MNLDERASRARNKLEQRATSDLDLVSARQSLDERSRRQHSSKVRARLGVAAMAALAVAGGIAIVSNGSDSPRDPEVAIDRDVDTTDDPTREETVDGPILENMPAGPTDGKSSWRLPVAVSPQSDLQEGQTVTIYGRGFDPNDSLGVVHCSSEADGENAGIDACDLGSGGGFDHVQYVNADMNGDVVADVTVRRFIDTPGYGRIDCASAAERCLLGMGAISNYDRSGGVYINFAGAPDFPLPTFAVAGNGQNLVAGQPVQVDVTGWMPGRQLRVEQCVVGAGGFDGSEICQGLLDSRADGAGNFTASVTVYASVTGLGGESIPCENNCALRANGIGIPEGTTAPFPDGITIGFDPDSATATVPQGQDGSGGATDGVPETSVVYEDATEITSTTTAGGS